MTFPILDIRNGGMQLRTTRELTRKQQLQKKYTGSWVWRTTAALIDVTAAAKSPRWLSQVLGVAVEEVVDAIEGLEELGIIERTAEGYRRILKYVYFSDRDLDAQAVLSDHVMITSQVLSRLKPASENQKSFYRTGFVASNESLVKEFCLQLEVLMKEFIEKSTAAVSDRVVAFSFSNVKMTETLDPNNRLTDVGAKGEK